MHTRFHVVFTEHGDFAHFAGSLELPALVGFEVDVFFEAVVLAVGAVGEYFAHFFWFFVVFCVFFFVFFCVFRFLLFF